MVKIERGRFIKGRSGDSTHDWQIVTSHRDETSLNTIINTKATLQS